MTLFVCFCSCSRYGWPFEVKNEDATETRRSPWLRRWFLVCLPALESYVRTSFLYGLAWLTGLPWLYASSILGLDREQAWRRVGPKRDGDPGCTRSSCLWPIRPTRVGPGCCIQKFCLLAAQIQCVDFWFMLFWNILTGHIAGLFPMYDTIDISSERPPS